MLKNKLRTHYLHLRNQLPTEQHLQAGIKLANNSLRLPIWKKQLFHLFLPIAAKNEIDTSSLLTVLHAKVKDVAIPKMFPDKQLRHFLLTDATILKTNSFGVPEPQNGIEILPETLDVVFIPLLAFDRKGYRVGYGGGYYDRFLARCRADVVKVGLSLFEPVDTISDLNSYDVPMNYALTPDEIYDF